MRRSGFGTAIGLALVMAQPALAQDGFAKFGMFILPDDMPEVLLGTAPLGILKVLREAGLASSGTEAQRNVEQGGVRVNGDRIEDKSLQLPAGTYVVQVGKRKFARVTLTG